MSATALVAHIQKGHTPNPVTESQQLLINIIPHAQSIESTLYLWEKDTHNEWRLLMPPFACTIGKNGAAWGSGLLDDSLLEGPRRVEGNPQAPLGIFSLGTAFGMATADSIKTAWPYRPSTNVDFCVDDPHSQYYNQIVNENEVKKDWTSAEEMCRKDGLYDWGIFVHHNSPAQGADGSCIMLHVWRGAGQPTHGCAAMPKAKIKHIIEWLRPTAQPRFIQLTAALYPTFQDGFDLPQM